MKSIFSIIITLVVFLPGVLLAQTNPLDGFLEKYSGEKGFYYLDLNTNMFSKSCEDEAQDFEKKVNIKMLSYDETLGKGKQASDMYNVFINQFRNDDYIGLVEVRHSGENVEILVKKENKMVTEFILAMQEKESVTLVAATGNFDLKDLTKLKSLQNCKGMNILHQMCDE